MGQRCYDDDDKVIDSCYAVGIVLGEASFLNMMNQTNPEERRNTGTCVEYVSDLEEFSGCDENSDAELATRIIRKGEELFTVEGTVDHLGKLSWLDNLVKRAWD